MLFSKSKALVATRDMFYLQDGNTCIDSIEDSMGIMKNRNCLSNPIKCFSFP